MILWWVYKWIYGYISAANGEYNLVLEGMRSVYEVRVFGDWAFTCYDVTDNDVKTEICLQSVNRLAGP